MSIEEYILKDTEFEVHQEFDEDQILATFLSDDGEEEGPNETNSPINEQPEITLDEKISAFRTCIEVLGENTLDHYNEIKTLRRFFYTFAEEKRQKLDENLKQTDIRSFLTNKFIWGRNS